MTSRESSPEEATYALGATSRLTGLTPDLLRAWERRYEVVTPLRTGGGTRRYRASDVERLRLIKAVVDAGDRISEVAKLETAELKKRIVGESAKGLDPVGDVIEALENLDGPEADRLISLQLAALGPVRFARQFALPLLDAIGQGWEERRLCIASEHLGSSILRSLLGASLRVTRANLEAPPVVFATPYGERHELGLLVAALAALGAGGNPVFLGADLPVAELLRAVEILNARALALSLVAIPIADANRALRELNDQLPSSTELWVGGPQVEQLELPPGVIHTVDLDAVEHHISLLAFKAPA